MEFDPLDPDVLDDPHARYADLRRTCPVAHSDRWNGFWALFRYDDVRRVAADPRTFTTTVQNVVPKVAFTGRRPPMHFDPPEHTPYRRALDPLLTAARAAVFEPAVRVRARELLDDLVTGEPVDIAAGYAAQLPVFTFARFLNVDAAAMDTIRRAWLVYNRALQDADDATVKEQSLVLYGIARDLVDERRARPLPDDPASALLAADLPDAYVVGTVRQVMVTGMVAPTVTLSSAIGHLAGDPALQDRLRAGPELLPAAIEELLRLYSPYRGFARTPRHDVEVGGRTISAGAPVAMTFTSASRDEAVFAAPDEFRLGRPTRHLAFGLGPLRCAGAELARMQLRVGLGELLARTRSITPAGPPEMTRWPEYGPVGLPVRLDTVIA
ncbi:cytochrome P450 [Virgisporangium ochraceum]